MAQYRVKDRVSGTETEISLEAGATVAEAIDVALSTLALPRRSSDGSTLAYVLSCEGIDEPLAMGERIDARVTPETDVVELSSASASVVWEQVQGLLSAINAEFEDGAGDFTAAARDEIRTGIDTLKVIPAEEIRGLISGATDRLTVEVKQRIHGFGRDLSLRAQRRIKRRIRKITATGALPIETSTLASAAGNLATVARSALVVPLAATVAAAAATAGIALGLARDANNTAEMAVTAAATAQENAEAAGEAALRAEARAAIAIADAETAKREAEMATSDAESAQLAANIAAADAALAQQTADEHEERPANVHEAPIRRLAGQQVDSQLSTSYDLRADVPRSVQSGDSLWAIALLSLQGHDGYDHGCGEPLDAPTNAQVAEYAAQLWIANVGVIGADPNLIETGEDLQLVCPSSIE